MAIEGRLKKNEIIRQEYGADIIGLNQFFKEAKNFEDLKELSEDRKIRQYKKKSNVYWEGDYANSIIFINSGKIKTYKTNNDGKQLITGIHGAGDFIGFNALLTGTEYSESAMAMEDVEVCRIPKDDFFNLLYSNRDVANKFIRILSNNLKDREEQLLHLAYNNVRQRVSEALLKLSDQYGSDFSIPRDDLAGMVGTAQESVIRTLSDFKEENLIEINSGKIRTVNIEKLQSVAKRGY